MNIILFTHPTFFTSKSMPKYAGMLSEGMKSRGHTTQVFTARAFFYNIPSPLFLKKWLGYIDQFIVFPILLKRQLKKTPVNTLFVFTDQALGPWIPYVIDRPHVIHCHDFLAQRSAKGEIQENKVGVTGKIYQAFIRRGFRKASNFICISEKTRRDLHLLVKKEPQFSEVVYNGFNQYFQFGDCKQARIDLQKKVGIPLTSGFILHVGGNQFYKNRKGVINIFCQWKKVSGSNLPLLLIGAMPTKELIRIKMDSEFSSDIHFLINTSDDTLKKAYHGAILLLYPSLEEGFGWPIAEAMASGCPVITINKAPMNEVGAENCFYLSEPPREEEEIRRWLKGAAGKIEEVCSLSEKERDSVVNKAGIYARRFDSQVALEKIEIIYKNVLKSYRLL